MVVSHKKHRVLHRDIQHLAAYKLAMERHASSALATKGGAA